MTITQIECFVEAANTGSISKAGTNLFISQQTVSRQIKALETELDMPLFERMNRGVRLTPQGEILYHSWKELLVLHRTAVDQAKDMYYQEQTNISIGIQELGSISEKVLHGIELYNERYPDLTVECEILPGKVLLHRLEQGALHMIIVFESELEKISGLKIYPLIKEKFPVGFYLAARHPILDYGGFDIERLAGCEIGVLDSNASLDDKERVENALDALGVLDKVQIREYKSRQSLLLALLSGKCITIAYENMFSGREDKLNFYPLPDVVPTSFGIVLAVKQEKYKIKARNLMEILEQIS